jgi:hypothetical protein
MTTWMVLAHVAAAWFLVGLTWTVQLVNYPLMTRVGAAEFPGYEAGHAPRMAAAVGPAWAVQAATTAWLLLSPPAGAEVLVRAAAASALVPVLVTLAVSVPAHARLAGGFDAAVHRRLLRSHAVRTAAWTGHAAVAVALLHALIRAG